MASRRALVTLNDIARETGFSDSTVSRALNDSPRIPQETKDRIREVAARLQYRPNFHAQGLARGRSQMQGMIVPDLRGTLLMEVVEAAEAAFHRRGQRVLLLHSRWDLEMQQAHFHFLQTSRISGTILCPVGRPAEVSQLRGVIREGMCVVLVDRYFPQLKVSHVVTDNEKGGRLAAEHLLSRGHRRFAVLTATEGEEITSTTHRLEGFLAALRDAGRPTDAVRVIRFNLMDEATRGFPVLQRFITERPHPDAVFAINDCFAMAFYQTMMHEGLRLRDIDLVGFDDARMLSFMPLPWSSVAQPKEEMGRRAAEILMEMLDRGPSHIVRETLPPRLIAR